MAFEEYSKYGKRLPVRGGIVARSRRGTFGSTWWGRALVDAVESLADPGRLARGRTYARGGQVVTMTVGTGVVSAEVQGSQPKPFISEFTVEPLDDDSVQELVDTVRATPGMLAELVSGSVPRALGPLLLPSSVADLDFDCSCPDSGWPCKHVAAVVYLTAEHLDERPADILTLRGVDLDTVMSGVETAQPTADDLFGDHSTLPALPVVTHRAAMDDLDPALLRRALRTMSDDERVVGEGVRALSRLYADLGG